MAVETAKRELVDADTDMNTVPHNTTSRWRKAAARMLSLFAQPVRKAPSKGGIAVQANRGYGSREEIFCIGRVFQQSRALVRRADPHSILDQLREVRRRINRRSLADVVVTAEFYGPRSGSLRIGMVTSESICALGSIPPADMLWHTVDISIDSRKPSKRKLKSSFRLNNAATWSSATSMTRS